MPERCNVTWDDNGPRVLDVATAIGRREFEEASGVMLVDLRVVLEQS